MATDNRLRAVLLAGVLLAGCVPTAQPPVVSTPTLVATLVELLSASIKEGIREKCGWVEDQGIIAQIVKAFILANAGTTANEVYNSVITEVCGTVAALRRPGRLSAGRVSVRGVPLRGYQR